MKERASKSAAAKLKKLMLLARQLRAGEDFQITRLTVLKGWCENPIAAGRFSLHLAERSKDRATRKFKPLIANALRQVKKHLANYRQHAVEPLWCQ